VFKNTILHGFKNNSSFDVIPSHRKWLGLNGYKHFAQRVKQHMANIRTKGGFEGSDLYNDSQDLYTGIEHLRKLMLGKKLLSCKEPGHEFTADFSENGPNSGLAFGSLLEIQNIASAAE
jgi:hypothetical protein